MALDILKHLKTLPTTGFQEVLCLVAGIVDKAVSFEPHQLPFEVDAIKSDSLRERLRLGEPMLFVEFFSHITNEVVMLNGEIKKLQQDLIKKIRGRIVSLTQNMIFRLRLTKSGITRVQPLRNWRL